MRVYALVIGLVLSVGVSSAAAQTGASFGVKAGANFANLNYSGDNVDISPDQRIGLVAGAFVLAPMSPTFAVQIEALYSQKGSTFEEGGFKSTTELDMFDIPVLARYTIPSSTSTSFHLFAGPSFNFKLSANDIEEFDGQEEKIDISDDVEGFEFGLVFGAGVEFGKFIIDGRYSHGFTNLNKDASEGVEVKTRVFSIMAGLRF